VDMYALLTDSLDEKQTDQFLARTELRCLKPRTDLAATATKALADGKDAKSVVAAIEASVGNIGVPELAGPVVSSVVKSALADEKGKLDSIDAYAPLIKRVLPQDQGVAVAVLNRLMQELPAEQVKAVFTKLYTSGAISGESFLAWQHDDPFSGRAKAKKPLNAEEKKQQGAKREAIFAVASWLETVQQAVDKANQPEDEGEGDEGDEGDDAHDNLPTADDADLDEI